MFFGLSLLLLLPMCKRQANCDKGAAKKKKLAEERQELRHLRNHGTTGARRISRRAPSNENPRSRLETSCALARAVGRARVQMLCACSP